MLFFNWLRSLIPARRVRTESAESDPGIAQSIVDPAFAAKSRSWQASFEDLRRDLVTMATSTENEFLAIGSNLNSLSEDCRVISSKASGAMKSGENENGFDMDKIEQLFKKAFESTTTCASAIPTGIDEMAGLRSSLSAIVELRSYLAGLSRSITIVGVLTRIETARFEGNDFDTMTTVVDDLARQIERSTEAIMAATRDANTTIEDISKRMTREFDSFNKDLVLTREHARGVLAEITEMKTRASGACKRIDERSAEIITEIGEIVAALQFHDICRQQMEHVAQTLQDAAGKVGDSGDATDVEIRSLRKWLDDVLRIQISQLESVISQTGNAAGGITMHLTRISDLSEAQQKESGVILEKEGAGGLRIRTAIAELDSLTNLNARSKSMTTEMMTAVSDAGGRIGTMSEHVANIVSISDNISLLAMNALIKVARSGEAGRTLAVLADKIRSLSQQAQEEVKQGTETIKGILERSATFKEILSAALSESIASADAFSAESRTAIQALTAADAGMVASLSDMAKITSTLKSTIEQLVAGIRFNETMKTAIGGVIARLQAVLSEIDETIPDAAGETPPPQTAEMQDLMQRYTMQHERDIHESLIDRPATGTTVPAPHARGSAAAVDAKQIDDSNIELF